VAVQLRLPEPDGLPPVVVFHREHPSEPLLVLQVPDPGAEDSETYMIRLDRSAHRTWMERLPAGKRLLYILQMEMHVAYEPATGAVHPLQDLDEVPRFAREFAEARYTASHQAEKGAMWRRTHTMPPAMSRFRMRLLGRDPMSYGKRTRMARPW